jgi:hypothetical protein
MHAEAPAIVKDTMTFSNVATATYKTTLARGSEAPAISSISF